MSTTEWTAARGTDGTWNVVGKDGAIICGCVYPSPDDEAIANRFAAVNELLAACEEAVRLYETYALVAQPTQGLAPGNWINECRAAITKAKGAGA